MEQRESMSKGHEVGTAACLKYSEQTNVALVGREKRRDQSVRVERKQAFGEAMVSVKAILKVPAFVLRAMRCH